MATKGKETTAEDAMAELYASFSQEELAEFFGATGQAANVQDKTPTLKVNYCDIPDKNGKEIKKGNFVIFQNSSEVEVPAEGGTELRVEDIGVDLGKNPKITVLTYGYMYAFYPKDRDKKKTCTSQLVFDRRSEKAIGNNLQHECAGGTCPRRSKDAERDDKCSCQTVVFVEVMVEDKPVKARMFFKGKSYLPFDEYVKAAGTTPLFFAPTKLSTKMERDGSVTYFVIIPELLKTECYPQLEIKRNHGLAKATREGAEQLKLQLAQKSTPRAQIADKSEGRNVTIIQEDELGEIAFD